jgi:hypothetical protein
LVSQTGIDGFAVAQSVFDEHATQTLLPLQIGVAPPQSLDVRQATHPAPAPVALQCGVAAKREQSDSATQVVHWPSGLHSEAAAVVQS